MELELGLCINIIKRLPVVAKFYALLTDLYYKTLHYKMISGLMMSSIPGMRVSGVHIYLHTAMPPIVIEKSALH